MSDRRIGSRVGALRTGELPHDAHAGLDTAIAGMHRELYRANHMKTETPNREGITFREWLYAAKPEEASRYYEREGGDVHVMNSNRATYAGLRAEYNAWNAGEDPTEWRAA